MKEGELSSDEADEQMEEEERSRYLPARLLRPVREADGLFEREVEREFEANDLDDMPQTCTSGRYCTKALKTNKRVVSSVYSVESGEGGHTQQRAEVKGQEFEPWRIRSMEFKAIISDVELRDDEG